ncbi:Protein transport Sec1a [Morella rubra]|uniref:Protein transport Sec1a n=1 Tax=Morella rubra TaxID=262757 RepID=A0A6A1VBC7_9ROSI|nr:Protein transport Sec1a [Morella rubra]
MGLRELGQLEQDLVFGDAGAKDVINFLRTKQDATPENKLRLLMIFASVYPEKFEGDKASKLMQVAAEFQFLVFRDVYSAFISIDEGEP